MSQAQARDAAGDTPLHVACRKGHTAVATALLAASASGPAGAATQRNAKGQLPAELAAAGGWAELALQVQQLADASS